jgi:predicted RNA methylase
MRPDLARLIEDAGFTPSVRDVDALVDLLVQEAHARAAEKAILRVGPPAFPRVRARLSEAAGPLRSAIVRVLGRLVDRESREDVAVLLGLLRDAEPKARRNAAIALGHVPGDAVEGALLSAWHDDPRPEMRRSIAASLGKIGSARSIDLLREASASSDPELSRIAARAAIIVDRTGSRDDPSAVDVTRTAPRATPILLLARRGLEDLLAAEASRIADLSQARGLGNGRVSAELTGPLQSVFRARTMLEVRFPLPTERVLEGETLAVAIARAMAGPRAREALETWTRGSVRYRIAWSDGAHRRAETWATARAIAERGLGYVNDPTGSNWEIVVARNARTVDIEMAPRRIDDPRFSWRRADVPAASHPTVAAALALVAGVRPDDVVWDPFVGSGAELVERGLAGAYESLMGSDLDSRALAAAQANLSAAGLTARLELGSALDRAPEGVTLVITNPPMGRRSSRSGELREMLDRFVPHVASVLRAGGRLVWMAPWPERARAAAERAGLELASARSVDMGGFEVELQHWIKA